MFSASPDVLRQMGVMIDPIVIEDIPLDDAPPDSSMVVKNVAPHIRAENERRRREEQEAFRKQAEEVRKTLREAGRQDLVDELDREAERNKNIGKPPSLIWFLVFLWVIYKICS